MGTCQMRLKYTSGFPYVCSLPAELCNLVSATTERRMYLCSDCQLLAEDQGFQVRTIKHAIEASPEFPEIQRHTVS